MCSRSPCRQGITFRLYHWRYKSASDFRRLVVAERIGEGLAAGQALKGQIAGGRCIGWQVLMLITVTLGTKDEKGCVFMKWIV